ncbi:MAG TPA: hypothetical protein ENG74_00510 [Thermoplasmatales archaeon]|nr:hypothetical protein [Thermoplasmatales archaeon]
MKRILPVIIIILVIVVIFHPSIAQLDRSDDSDDRPPFKITDDRESNPPRSGINDDSGDDGGDSSSNSDESPPDDEKKDAANDGNNDDEESSESDENSGETENEQNTEDDHEDVGDVSTTSTSNSKGRIYRDTSDSYYTSTNVDSSCTNLQNDSANNTYVDELDSSFYLPSRDDDSAGDYYDTTDRYTMSSEGESKGTNYTVYIVLGISLILFCLAAIELRRRKFEKGQVVPIDNKPTINVKEISPKEEIIYIPKQIIISEPLSVERD